MFEEPDLQDPLSLSLNENYDEHSFQRHDSRKAQASPEYSCETQGIQVIIKEEEDGWTVSENYEESFNSEIEREDATAHTNCPQLTSCRQKSTFSHGGENQPRSILMENCSEELSDLAAQRPSSREKWQKDRLVGCDEKPKFSLMRGKDPGNVHQCNIRVSEITPSDTENIKSHQGTREGDGCYLTDQSVDATQSTSRLTEAELHKIKQPALYQTDSPENKFLVSHRLKKTNIEDQTLHLTVRLQAGEEEEEEEQHDGEIGGLINSDGEVVEWDSRESPDRSSDCTESPQPSKSQMQIQNQRGSGPMLIMDVVTVEDEEQEEREAKERAVKMALDSPFCYGKKSRREESASNILQTEVPPAPAKKHSRRRSSEVPLLSVEELQREPGISRRTRVFIPW